MKKALATLFAVLMLTGVVGMVGCDVEDPPNDIENGEENDDF